MPAVMLHVAGVSDENVTARPEVAVAMGEYVLPTRAGSGIVDENEIVWAVAAMMNPVYSSRLGVPSRGSVILLAVAFSTSAAATCAGVALGYRWRYSAAAPATCGAAMLVPLIVSSAVVLVYHADTMPVPGANRSTHDPKFEKLERASRSVEAATVMAAGALAGEKPHASFVSLPAATTYTMPALIEFVTAVFIAVETPPPRLMFTTDNGAWLSVTQSIPSMTLDALELPEQFKDAHADEFHALRNAILVPPDGPGHVRAMALAVSAVASLSTAS